MVSINITIYSDSKKLICTKVPIPSIISVVLPILFRDRFLQDVVNKPRISCTRRARISLLFVGHMLDKMPQHLRHGGGMKLTVSPWHHHLGGLMIWGLSNSPKRRATKNHWWIAMCCWYLNFIPIFSPSTLNPNYMPYIVGVYYNFFGPLRSMAISGTYQYE